MRIIGCLYFCLLFYVLYCYCCSIIPQEPQKSISMQRVRGASPRKPSNTNRQRFATALSRVNKERRERGNSPENHGRQTAELENRLNFVEKRKEDEIPDLKQIYYLLELKEFQSDHIGEGKGKVLLEAFLGNGRLDLFHCGKGRLKCQLQMIGQESSWDTPSCLNSPRYYTQSSRWTEKRNKKEKRVGQTWLNRSFANTAFLSTVDIVMSRCFYLERVTIEQGRKGRGALGEIREEGEKGMHEWNGWKGKRHRAIRDPTLFVSLFSREEEGVTFARLHVFLWGNVLWRAAKVISFRTLAPNTRIRIERQRVGDFWSELGWMVRWERRRGAQEITLQTSRYPLVPYRHCYASRTGQSKLCCQRWDHRQYVEKGVPHGIHSREQSPDPLTFPYYLSCFSDLRENIGKWESQTVWVGPCRNRIAWYCIYHRPVIQTRNLYNRKWKIVNSTIRYGGRAKDERKALTTREYAIDHCSRLSSWDGSTSKWRSPWISSKKRAISCSSSRSECYLVHAYSIN